MPREVLYAARTLAKKPGFAAVAVLAIALSIEASSTDSVVDILIALQRRY